MPGPTITVKGENGSIFDMDVPDEGSVRREVFDQSISKGRLVVLSGDWPPDVEPEGPPDPDAKVGVWRNYASTLAQTADEAAAIAKMTKPALIEAYGTPEDETS